MYYLLAKDFHAEGCIVIAVESAAEFSALCEEAQNSLRSHNIEIVTISRPLAYGEYAPYTLISDVGSFRKALARMDSVALERDKNSVYDTTRYNKTVSNLDLRN